MSENHKIDAGAVKGKVSPETVAIITAALGMFLQNEKLEFKILNINQVHSSDINLWGVSGRIYSMERLGRSKW